MENHPSRDGQEERSRPSGKKLVIDIGTSLAPHAAERDEESTTVVTANRHSLTHHEETQVGAEVSDCGRYLLVSPVRDCRDNLLYFADLSKHPEITGLLPLTQIVHKFEADYEVI
ncbi:hypothetical protein RR48_04489 [Papilio machaon]|uniref:Peptidase S9A N-terminal domain-containing protein n=1 Tax=Papilio machaon TaxID=76193 RepID=A0A0N1IGI1_PAPMA|nr:hypothetical protein RR48_04489 [Papilio machaon]